MWTYPEMMFCFSFRLWAAYTPISTNAPGVTFWTKTQFLSIMMHCTVPQSYPLGMFVYPQSKVGQSKPVAKDLLIAHRGRDGIHGTNDTSVIFTICNMFDCANFTLFAIRLFTLELIPSSAWTNSWFNQYFNSMIRSTLESNFDAAVTSDWPPARLPMSLPLIQEMQNDRWEVRSLGVAYRLSAMVIYSGWTVGEDRSISINPAIWGWFWAIISGWGGWTIYTDLRLIIIVEELFINGWRLLVFLLHSWQKVDLILIRGGWIWLVNGGEIIHRWQLFSCFSIACRIIAYMSNGDDLG